VEYQKRIEAVPGIESEWVALTRDYTTNQISYSGLLTKAEAAKVAVNLEQREIGEQFRIIDAAQIPVHPVTSIRATINTAGLALGLLLGLGMAAFLEHKDTTFRSDSDVLQALSLPVLANVPRIVTATERVRNRNRKLLGSIVGIACLVCASYLTWTLKLWNSIV
jgi:hypothetical protein